MSDAPDRILVEWLIDRVDQPPRHGLERALAATRRTNQRPRWTYLRTWFAPTGVLGSVMRPLRRHYRPRRRVRHRGAGLHGPRRAGSAAQRDPSHRRCHRPRRPHPRADPNPVAIPVARVRIRATRLADPGTIRPGDAVPRPGRFADPI